MDKRKEAILRAITDDYIETAEPVGSRTIARKYKLGVSPATIRNEMADLEESGYLQQPHTSAGRIPSDKGYRFYVDMLMPPPDLPREVRQRVRQQVEVPSAAVEDMVRRATRLLATLTHYAAVAIAPSLRETVVKIVQFVPVDENNVLIVVVTEPGFVQNRIVEVPRVNPELLLRCSMAVNRRLKGKTLSDLTSTLLAEIAAEISAPDLFEALMSMLSAGLDSDPIDKVFLEGGINLIDQPEFRELQRAKTLLAALEEREYLYEMFSRNARGTTVAIGAENEQEPMRECSIVTSTYMVNGRIVGAVGVIGPTRMEYQKAISLVETIAETLSDMLGTANR